MHENRDIFIASSTQGKAKGKIIKRLLEERGVYATGWWEAESFKAGKYTLENLENVACNDFDGAICIFERDDQIIFKPNEKPGADDDLPPTSDPSLPTNVVWAARDNVVLEAGYFAGIMGRKSVIICLADGVKKPTDLKGVTSVMFPSDMDNTTDLRYFVDQLVSSIKEMPRRQCRNISGNVRLHSRDKIQNRLTVRDRFYEGDDINSSIREVRIVNLACNLVFNPHMEQPGQLPTGDVKLGDAIQDVLTYTNAAVRIAILKPTEKNLLDVETKIANDVLGGSTREPVWEAWRAMHQNLTEDTIYRDRSCFTDESRRRRMRQPVTFRLYALTHTPTMGLFEMQYAGDNSTYDHIKVDLYTPFLEADDERRSFVLWKAEDVDNYNFFHHLLDRALRDPKRCSEPTPNVIGQWLDDFDNAGIYPAEF